MKILQWFLIFVLGGLLSILAFQKMWVILVLPFQILDLFKQAILAAPFLATIFTLFFLFGSERQYVYQAKSFIVKPLTRFPSSEDIYIFLNGSIVK